MKARIWNALDMLQNDIVLAILVALIVWSPFLLLPARGQVTSQVHENPDCQFYFTFTAASGSLPAGNGFDNRQQGCNTWSIVYFNYNFSPVSLTFQSAANNAGSAGTWGTGFPVQQTIVAGSNPQTSTAGGYLWISGTNAFVRVTMSATGTGNVTGAAFGWRIPNAQ
jgi:hypothetical protein